jgi:tetratricopeptide (TPR) repeat protein
MLRRTILYSVLSICVLTALFCSADEKNWTEVRSPHFRVITNGNESSARRLAREYEQMRAVFADQFSGFRLDTGAPLLIIAPSDLSAAKKVAPEVFERKGAEVAGFYAHGWERQYAFVRLDAVRGDPMLYDTYSVIYHEYLHSLLHTNFHWLPTWLDEGLASFYQYTRFEQFRTLLGAPPRNGSWTSLLERGPLIPMDVFLNVDGTSPYYGQDKTKTYMFYAQAWATTHFLTFGPGMEQGRKLRQFFNLLQKGTEQKKAFEQTFGSFEDVNQGLQQYVLKWAFTTAILPLEVKTDDKDFTVRTMPPAETEAELAAFHILHHRWREMRELTEAALKDDPKLGLAHQDMGYFQFNEGKNDEALREFTRAFELDGKLYGALFAKTMISPISQSNDPADQKTFHDLLIKVLDINPDFAPAFVELAKLYIRQGDLNKALGMSRKAEQLEPWRAGYHLLSGQILFRLGRFSEAAADALYVANRWASVDRDEAMELWNSVPRDKRPAEVPAEDKTSKSDWLTAEGTVKSASCEEHSYTIVLDHSGQSLNFHTLERSSGFSDTHWWGRDHFTPCFHVAGLRAVVHYKPSSDKSYIGEMVNVGFRDDLPASPVKALVETTPQEKKN